MAPPEPIYVYGLCSALHHPPVLPLGLEGEVHLVVVGALAAIAEAGLNLSTLEADNPRLLTAVLNHDRVLCDLFQHTTLLPLRFGTQLASLEKLREHLAQNQSVYEAKLAALEQKAEYQIKLVAQPITPAPLPDGLKGRDYFLAKKQRLQSIRETQQQQQDELQTLQNQLQATYANRVAMEPAEEGLKVYLLLPTAEEESLKERVEEWQSQSLRWQLWLSDRLPPYHFV